MKNDRDSCVQNETKSKREKVKLWLPSHLRTAGVKLIRPRKGVGGAGCPKLFDHLTISFRWPINLLGSFFLKNVQTVQIAFTPD